MSVVRALASFTAAMEAPGAAPLRPAEDAVVLDTTGNTFQQSLRQILDIIRERIAL